jgi:hypothetical protein
MRRGKTSGIWLCSVLCCFFGVIGCEEEKKPAASSGADGGISDKPAIDPSIAKAMAAASAKKGGAAANNAGGPPASGVFEPGEADKQLARGAAPKITLGSEGSEPRVTLTVQPKPGFKRTMNVQLLMRSGRQGLPPLDFTLLLQAQKPKAPAAAAEPAAANAAPEPVAVVGTVQAVRIAQSQGMAVPKEAQDELGTLKGSKVEFNIQPNGAGDGFRYELSKTADPGMENLMRSFTETLTTVILPYPDKPVGAGAFWMATSRENAIGVDVIAYRMVKVESIEGDKIKLSVNSKRYAVEKKFDLPELPRDQKFSLDEFQSIGEGQFEMKKDVAFPTNGELSLGFVATLLPEGQAGQPGQADQQRPQVESRTRAQFSLSAK